MLAQWTTVKPAYRILLEDGTELIASADHRFLTERGWKFVVGAEQGRERRPLLVLGDRMSRVSALTQLRPAALIDDPDSRAYLACGDALLGVIPRRIVTIEPVGRNVPLVDITTGTGDFIANGAISHNCYARVTHWYMDQDGVNDWSSKIFVKVNAPEVLRRELARTEWTREQVAVGTATDPYQPAEGAYRVTRRILEALRDYRTPISLITRSPMVVRDTDVLRQLSKIAGASVCFSLITMDPDLARELEPSVAPPLKRLEALRRLAQAGIRTTVNLAPVLPGITDNERNLEGVIRAAKEHGASQLWTNALHLGEVVRDAFFKYLREKRPHLIPEYERMYPKRYAPREYQERVQRIVAGLKAKVGFSGPRHRDDERNHGASPPDLRQIQLFGQTHV